MNAFYSILALGLGGVLVSGCATAAKHPSPAPVSQEAGAEEDLTPDEARERAAGLPLPKGNPEAFARYAAGVSYELNDEDEQAVQQFDEAALADPANEPLVEELTRRFLRDKQTDKALALLSTSARRPEASAELLSWLARAQWQAGLTNKALATAKLAVQRQPDLLDGYECQVEILFHNRQWAEALKTLQRAAAEIRADPSALAALAGLYAAYLKDHPNDTQAKSRAVAVVDRAAQIKFTDARLWQRLADAYSRLDQPRKAADIYVRLLSEYPDASMMRDTIHEKLAGIYFEVEDKTNAAKQLQAIVRDNPTRYPRAWLFLGELAFEDNKLSEAVDDFQNALHWDPSIEQAYYDLALAQLDLHQSTAAFQTLDQARQRFPKTFSCEFYTGVVHAHVKNYAEAIRHFKEAEVIGLATDASKLDQRFYFQFGAACERNQDYGMAEEYLQKCVNLAPDFGEALNYLGYMLADRGEQLPRARALIEKAVKLEPRNGAYLDSLGWVLFKLHQPEEALPWLLKAQQYTPEADATVLDHLGEVYMALHQTGKAIEAWKKSFSIEASDAVKRKLDLYSGGSW
ncbi:MAG: tetratricopeptide repeat protein [Verrucomicrobiota bacterium]|jgi:tetratricopeptide (TPR) repeat protein